MLRVIRKYRAVSLVLILAFASQASAVNPAHARMLGTGAVLGSEQTEQRAAIRALLAKDQVRSALRAYGVAPEEAMARVAAFSDAEVALIAAQIEDDPAGQALGLLLAAGLVALIVLIVADLTGHTDVF